MHLHIVFPFHPKTDKRTRDRNLFSMVRLANEAGSKVIYYKEGLFNGITALFTN